MTKLLKKYSCEYCGISFTQKSHLRTHLIRQPPCHDVSVESMIEIRQDTGKFRTNLKDKFYTKPTISKKCIDILLEHIPILQENSSKLQWIEPSAGNGSFLSYFPKSSLPFIAIDIDPPFDSKEIEQSDYLTWTPPQLHATYVVVGNPPFGRQGSLAKAFIRKSCSYADIIAFILPRSFTKPSMYQVFDPAFHLIYTYEIEKDAFLLNESSHDVPCIFQIWEKRNTTREPEQKLEPIGYRYVKQDEEHHMICRRVGANAGRCYINLSNKMYSSQSHYFIQLDSMYIDNADELVKGMNNHNFPSNTVGPRSLSKSEVSSILNQLIQYNITSK